MTNYLYRVHINEEYFYDVKAPDVEAALLQAMALYRETPLPKPSPEWFEHYEIYIENTTQFKALQEANKAKKETTTKLQNKDKTPA